MNLLSPEQARLELTTKIQLKKELDRRLIEQRACNEFPYFVTHVFAASFDHFVGGEYIETVAQFLDSSTKTARVSARDHFKSTSLYSRFMYHLFRERDRDFEAHYFSYQQELAGYHIAKLKKLIEHNPFFAACQDLKSNAESVGAWSWDGAHTVTLEPHGLLAFKRGIHCHWLAVDDPFQDPENKLEPTIIKKINQIFVSQILDMPLDGGELHVVGTPQTPQDFFFDNDVMRRFSVLVQPAIVSEPNRIALWPEHMSYEELEARRAERGAKLFNQEYLCQPVYTEDAYLDAEKVKACVDGELPNLSSMKKHKELKGDIIAGFDIGKKRHPSHLVVYAIKEGHATQVCSKWMDGWDYSNGKDDFDPSHPTQFEYLLEAKKNFGIDKLYYDGTRGEFEALADAGKMPDEFVAVVFTKKQMVGMAAGLSDRVEHGSVSFIDDPRQTSQMLAVNNDLQAMESPQGHGDSFWSNSLALQPQPEPGSAGFWSID